MNSLTRAINSWWPLSFKPSAQRTLRDGSSTDLRLHSSVVNQDDNRSIGLLIRSVNRFKRLEKKLLRSDFLVESFYQSSKTVQISTVVMKNEDKRLSTRRLHLRIPSPSCSQRLPRTTPSSTRSVPRITRNSFAKCQRLPSWRQSVSEVCLSTGYCRWNGKKSILILASRCFEIV